MHGELPPGAAVDLAVTKWEGTSTVDRCGSFPLTTKAAVTFK